ncbi:MAG: threonine ammonia-lyase [Chloroherpetonaceae bacterium]|nr:threonine ammonia-lyase [Chthonomonadaceae bacterium]MDW8206657.1 threonine ammonia-lyase [Chloroherpetonaceae bacterium]
MVSVEQIQAAYPGVREIAHHTPVMTCASMAERCSLPATALLLKLENQQRTGSFKIRGAYHRLTGLSDAEKARGVVAASAGNHAQGVALAAHLTGVRATVFMPEFASIAKIQATRRYGAEVVLEGSNFDEAVAAGRAFAAQQGAPFISAYDDDGIITGQGTLGLEILEDVPDLETILICVGGGGLFSGVATVIRALCPKARIIGVQAAGAPAAVESWRAGHLLPRGAVNTIADGVAIKSPSARTFAYIQRYADDMVTVEDSEIAGAMLWLLERAKTVVEPAGAVGAAALMSGRVKAQGKTVVILSGGNVSTKLLADLIEREMIRADRYMQFFTAVPDRPGGLAALLEVIAGLRGNIITVVHNRISPTVPLGQTGVEVLLEVRDAEHIARIREELLARNYRVDMLH